MNWVTGLQNAIDYIENHLTEKLDYTDIADKAFTSPFHFQRVFGILCNYTLGEYIRNRRLTLAGSELSSSDDAKVIDVALKYGYDSPESFSRAFTRFHGIAPSYAKMYGSKLKSFSRLSVKLILDGGTIMNYRIEKKDKIDVIVKKKNFSNDVEQNNRQLPNYWDDCRKDNTIDSLYKYAAESGVFGGALIGVCGEDTDKNEVTYAIGVEYNGSDITDELSVEQIPACTWAIFESVGPIPTAFQTLLYKVYSEFFPTSEYHPCGSLDIQVYPNGDMQSPQYKCELWIPVEKNQ